jgi:hypothetical protein
VQQPVVGLEQLHPLLVTDLAVQAGRVLDVGEHHRHGAVRRGDPGDLVAVLHRPRGEVVDGAEQDPAHSLLAHPGGRLDHGPHRHPGSLGGLHGARAARNLPLGAQRPAELGGLSARLAELPPEHAESHDGCHEQEAQDDRDHGGGLHGARLAHTLREGRHRSIDGWAVRTLRACSPW